MSHREIGTHEADSPVVVLAYPLEFRPAHCAGDTCFHMHLGDPHSITPTRNQVLTREQMRQDVIDWLASEEASAIGAQAEAYANHPANRSAS